MIIKLQKLSLLAVTLSFGCILSSCSHQSSEPSPDAYVGTWCPDGFPCIAVTHSGKMFSLKAVSHSGVPIPPSQLIIQPPQAFYVGGYLRSEPEGGEVVMSYDPQGKLMTWRGIPCKAISEVATTPSSVAATPQAASSPSDRTVNEAWAAVYAAYKQRNDLVANSLTTFQKIPGFSDGLATPVVPGINPSAAPQSVADLERFNRAQTAFNQSISRLLMLSERSPDVKTDQNFLSFEARLAGYQNRISLARAAFNEAAKHYNELLPSGVHGRPYFSDNLNQEKAPAVDFNFGAPTAPTP